MSPAWVLDNNSDADEKMACINNLLLSLAGKSKKLGIE